MPLKLLSIWSITYSQISKLEEPVNASIPFSSLKFDFCGKLKSSLEFVAQGGFPITRTFLYSQTSEIEILNILSLIKIPDGNLSCAIFI